MTLTVAQEVHVIHVNQTQIIIPDLSTIQSLLSSVVSSQVSLRSLIQQLTAQVAAIKAELAMPVSGKFNPPPDLVKVVTREVSMSVLQLEVGQTAVGKMTFNEPAPPADGAVMSDNTAVATISLDPDLITWHCVAVGEGTANISYSGTSAAPDVGAAVVPPMVVTVVAVPVAEHGDFDPTHAVITGP